MNETVLIVLCLRPGRCFKHMHIHNVDCCGRRRRRRGLLLVAVEGRGKAADGGGGVRWEGGAGKGRGRRPGAGEVPVRRQLLIHGPRVL